MHARHPLVLLSGDETARAECLAHDWTAGLLSIARLVPGLRWSARRGLPVLLRVLALPVS